MMRIAALCVWTVAGIGLSYAQNSLTTNNDGDLQVNIGAGNMFSVACPAAGDCSVSTCRGEGVEWDAATQSCVATATNGNSPLDKVLAEPTVIGIQAIIEYKKDYEIQIRGYRLEKLYGPELAGTLRLKFTDTDGNAFTVPGTARLIEGDHPYVEIVGQPSADMGEGTYTTEVFLGDIQIPYKGPPDATTFDVVQVVFKGLLSQEGDPKENHLTITGAGLFTTQQYKIEAATKQTDALSGTLTATVSANDTSHIPVGSVAALGRQLASFDNLIPASATITALGQNGAADKVVGTVEFELDRCFDGVKNANEADIDCGGTDCDNKCYAGQSCRVVSDCEHLSFCNLNVGICQDAFPDCKTAGEYHQNTRWKQVDVVQDGEIINDAMCSFASNEIVGGDGSTRDKAGKSCYTIRHAWGITSPAQGRYWVFMDDKNNPIQVHCDMQACGRDLSGEWDKSGVDKSGCGGWTLAMKDCNDCNNLNYHKDSRWKNPDISGSWNSKSEDGWAIGPPYQRQSYSDIMIQSMRDYRYNVAWRHPPEPDGKDKSLWETVRTCTWRKDGELLVPGYGKPTTRQEYFALYYLYWQDHRPSGPFPSNRWSQGCSPGQLSEGRGSVQSAQFPDANSVDCQYHGACIDKQHWGFFNRDIENDGQGASPNEGSSDVLGCPGPWGDNHGGHGGNVIGMGTLENGDSNRRHYNNNNYMASTYCITAYGFGGSYHGNNGGGHSGDTMNGHNWGNGNGVLYTDGSHGVLIRDIRD